MRPFGFLTWFHAKRTEEHFFEEGSDSALWDPRARPPKPVAPYDREISKAAENARDRETWEPVPKSWLRTYDEALRQYPIHPETKFLGGAHTQTGQLRRRHMFASAVEYIGKEADRWEEDSHFGADDDSAIQYGVTPADRATMAETITRAIRVEKIGVKRLAKKAGVADRTVTAVVNGGGEISGEDLVTVYRVAEALLISKRAEDERIAELLEWARAQPRSWLAAELDYDLSNLGKVFGGKIKPGQLFHRIQQLREKTTFK